MTHIRKKIRSTSTQTQVSSGIHLIHTNVTRIEKAWEPRSIQNSYAINIQNCKKQICTPFQVLLQLTYLRSWALLEEPLTGQPLKNFPASHATRRFNTVITRALQWSLSWALSIQSTPSHPICLRSILILSTHLRLDLPSGLFPSGFPTNHLIIVH
jgi:hypothetical protein